DPPVHELRDTAPQLLDARRRGEVHRAGLCRPAYRVQTCTRRTVDARQFRMIRDDMAHLHTAVAAALIVVVSGACPARALVLGGGPRREDCWAAFDGVESKGASRIVTCTDGDPRCDAGGAKDGVCRFRVRACVDVPGVPTCSPAPIQALHVRAIPKRSRP